MKTFFPDLVPDEITKEEFMNNITLKKYKECESRDGVAFSADFYYKKVKLGEIQDNGMGGELRIETYIETHRPKGKQTKVGHRYYEIDDTIYKIFDKIDKSELERVSDLEKEDGTYFIYNEDLESLFYHIVDRHCMAKEERKIFRKGIILEAEENGWERKGAYRTIHWRQSIPTLLKYNAGKAMVERKLKELVTQGEKIINEEYLKSLGLVF